ncbi:MAG: peptidylprolyl isomerase [Dysgonomonas sp.]
METEAKEKLVLIETTCGNIKIKLYDETPLHRDNFLKLVKNGTYKDVLFHRVIKDFMIQAGDPDSRTASDSAMLGEGDLEYTIPAEFRLPNLFHKKGALAAARQADNVNPKKESSASQFYIVTGKIFSEDQLQQMEKQRFERLKQSIFNELQTVSRDSIKSLYASGDKSALSDLRSKLQTETEEKANIRKQETIFTPEQRNIYTSIGGTPHLDGAYTVFGEVVEGMDIVDKIQNAAVNGHDRPLENIRIISAKVVKR